MLEVCIDAIDSAACAFEGGAARLELCSALSEGGLSPLAGTFYGIREILNLRLPIFCMLRPRRGNDFSWSIYEMEGIKHDMDNLRELGCEGFVFGALNGQTIDEKACRQVLRNANGLPCTFSRAFDLTNPEKMHENSQLIWELGFKRILTSGFQDTAEKGIPFLKELIDTKRNDLIFMPGAGITINNLHKIISETGCKEFHASARKVIVSKDCKEQTNISMGGSKEDAQPRLVADKETVRNLECESVKEI